MNKISLNYNWSYCDDFNEDFINSFPKGELVHLPHTNKELPFNNFSENEASIEVVNMTGNIVWTHSISRKEQIDISINQWPKGVYMIRVSTNEKEEWQRFIIK